MLSNHLSIFHLNIQSLLPKLDLIKAEADAYDVLVFSESWLKPDIQDDTISTVNVLPPFRKDRCERVGGGSCYLRSRYFFVQTSLRSRVALAGGSLDRNSSKIKIDTRRRILPTS